MYHTSGGCLCIAAGIVGVCGDKKLGRDNAENATERSSQCHLCDNRNTVARATDNTLKQHFLFFIDHNFTCDTRNTVARATDNAFLYFIDHNFNSDTKLP